MIRIHLCITKIKSYKMTEVIRHSLGLCGEGHPSLLYFIPMITFGIYIIKLYIKDILEIVKTIL